jgi:hypothetical protein
MWRARFGRDFGPFIRQTNKLNELSIAFLLRKGDRETSYHRHNVTMLDLSNICT